MEKFEIDYIKRISEKGCRIGETMLLCSICVLHENGFCPGEIRDVDGNIISQVTKEESMQCAKNYFKMEIWRGLK